MRLGDSQYLNNRHLYLHRGHCSFTPAGERRFITPELIRASGGLVGEPDEIVEQIRALEAGGLTETLLLPPVAVARDNFKSFAEQVVAFFDRFGSSCIERIFGSRIQRIEESVGCRLHQRIWMDFLEVELVDTESYGPENRSIFFLDRSFRMGMSKRPNHADR